MPDFIFGYFRNFASTAVDCMATTGMKSASGGDGESGGEIVLQQFAF